jgi:sialic acid synthase SpsE
MIFVAELSINHLGMINIAKAMIIAAKNSGANFIKIKIKNVNKYYKKKPSKWRGYDFLNYRESLELSVENIKEIIIFCKKIGIGWFSTVHDEESLNFIKQFKPSFIKIASMDNKNTNLIKKVISTCKKNKVPLIVSIGGQNETETANTVQVIKKANIKCFILHTVSIYPVPVGNSNIGYIDYLINKYQSNNIKIGYSGHEEGFGASIVAGLKKIHMIERHFTLDRNLKIHHIRSALLPYEFSEMIKLIKTTNLENKNQKISRSINENIFLKNRIYK